jgi:pyruvate dehydrogenase E2 component (dihydrolipoamide acetyltransferase)
MSADVYEVTMPKLGETVTEGVVSQWLKQVGDPVAFDDPLFEVSTDKVDSEVPSPYDGVLLEILVNEGDTVPVGTPLARIGEPGAQSAPSSAPPGAAAQVSETDEPATELAAVTTPPAGNGQPGVLLSPVVRRMAAEKGIDLAAVPGSGAGGRIRREDVAQAIAAQPAAGAPPAAASAPAPAVAVAPKPAASVSPGDEVVKLSRMRLITADLMVKSLKTSAHVWTSVGWTSSTSSRSGNVTRNNLRSKKACR